MTTLTERYAKWDTDRIAIYEEFPRATPEHPGLRQSDSDAVEILDDLAGKVGLCPDTAFGEKLREWCRQEPMPSGAPCLEHYWDAVSLLTTICKAVGID